LCYVAKINSARVVGLGSTGKQQTTTDKKCEGEVSTPLGLAPDHTIKNQHNYTAVSESEMRTEKT